MAARTTGKPKNARGRRQNPAVRLEGEMTIAPGKAPAAPRERGSDVRARVLQASLECFGAFGFAGTSTRAVADRAGVSHPLLLYHFQSKEQLWLSTMGDVIVRYKAALHARLETIHQDDAVGALRAFVTNFVEFSAQTPQLHRIMTQQSTQGSDRIRWLLDTHLRDSFKEICALIRRAQQAGTVRPGDPARLYYAVIGLGGTLFSVSTEYELLTRRDVFAKREVELTIRTILDFLFARSES
jgi:AcrR family transcriptional regulator